MIPAVYAYSVLFFASIFPTSFVFAGEMEKLVTSALENDSGVKSHLFLEQSASDNIDTAKWQFYPTPALTLQSAVAGFEDTASERVLTLSVRQPLLDGGRLKAGVERAQTDLIRQTNATQAKRIELAQQVIYKYSAWWVSQSKHASWNKALDIHEDLVQQVSRRVEVGVSAASDLSLAQGRLAATLAERDLSRAQEDSALEDLKSLIHLPSLQLSPTPHLPDAANINLTFSQLAERLVSVNLDLKQARNKANQASIDQRVQKASVWPTVQLQAERQIGDLNQSGYTPENKIFVSVSSELKPGLSFITDNSSSAAAYSAALEQVESEKARVTRKLKSDFILLKAAENRHEALQLAKQNALSGYESSSRQFKAGRKSWQELLNSARELAQADAQWVDAYGQYLVAAWQMLLDTQGLSFLVGEQSDA